ncbi:MAG TPA: hypothetical protein VN982_10170 [Candidatus Dormibacteraeota bacterium]|nr:hypothetical protein [Candidatus Dormibacteraeota bacterium]
MSTRKNQDSIRVLIHGLAFFARQFPDFLRTEGWEFRNYEPRWSAELAAMTYHLQRCDLAYTWSGRITMGKFLSMARRLGKKKLVMFWCGSDVLEARDEYDKGKMEPWIAEKIHWAGSSWLAEEVRAMGLECEYVPSTWVPAVQRPMALPSKFSVLAYLPDAERVSLYGIDQVIAVARSMPKVEFKIVGLRAGQTLNVPENVKLHRRTVDMTPFYGNATVIWRPAKHDGLSFMALEALAHGRHVIWSYPFTGAHHAKEAEPARIELQRLLELHEEKKLELNHTGADYVAQNFCSEKIKNNLLTRWRAIVEAPTMSAAKLNIGSLIS